jgi:outer membrane receptor protein involved in Fe transport
MAVGGLTDLFSGAPVAAARDGAYNNETSSESLDVKLQVGDTYLLGYNHRVFNGRSSVGTQPQFTNYNRFYESRVRMVYGDFKNQVSPELTSHLAGSYMIYDINPDSGYNNGFTGYSNIWKYANSQIFSLQQDFNWEMNTANHLIFGVNFINTHSLPQTTDLPRPVDPNQPLAGQGMFYPIATGLPIQFFEVSYMDLGAITQWESQLSERFASILGARYDHDSRFGDSFNPRAGLVYKVTESRVLKLTYAEAFRAPSPNIMYAHFGNFDGIDGGTGKPSASFFHVPNPDLKPEKSRTLELGYMQRLGATSIATASIYATRTNNLIIDNSSSTGKIDFAGGVIDGIIETAANRGHAEFFGGETGVNMNEHWGRWDLKPWINYSYSAGYLDSEAGAGHSELPYNTKNQLKGGVTFGRGKWSATPRYRITTGSTHINTEVDAKKRVHTPAASVVDLALRWEDAVKNLSVTLDARNLFDRHYYTPGSPYITDFVFNPQDTRSIQLEVSYTF